MGRHLLFFVVVFSAGFLFSQRSEGKVWVETGVSSGLGKSFDVNLDQTMRFGSDGLETYFPQLSLRYKWRKWIRPSLDYRMIFDKDKYGNYSFSSRLNLNTDLKASFKKVGVGMRIRYQYSFQGVVQKKYDAEFDQALRMKFYAKYTVKKSPLIPMVSAEWFYNPNYGPGGYSFSKERFFMGAQLKSKGPHDIAFGYIFDRELNVSAPDTRHILNVSYTYSIGGGNNDSDKQSSPGDLFNE